MSAVPTIVVALAFSALAGCSLGFVPGDGADLNAAPSGAVSQPVTAAPVNGRVQSSDGGAVTLRVEWKGSRNGLLTFDIVMDTHSVDLDSYDLRNLSVLRDDQGREYAPTAWRAPAGGHHRTGILEAPVPDSVAQGTARYVELIIRDVAGVNQRVLKWELI